MKPTGGKKKKGKMVKIARSYRKPMSEKKFSRLKAMLTDPKEQSVFNSAFPADEDGRRRFRQPENPGTAKKIADAVHKVHKARSGPRTVRFVLVLLVFGLPVLFNVFFLDFLAERRLERFLENTSGTDVTVGGLDISLSKGRINLSRLSFASRTEPMIDEWTFNDIQVDLSLQALLRRRLVMDSLESGIAYRTARDTQAVYPEIKRGGEDTGAAEPSRSLQDFDWIPSEDLPDDSIALTKKLKEDAQSEYREWEAELERESVALNNLMQESRDFADKPLPGKTDVSAWLAHIEEGKTLLDQLQWAGSMLENYRARLNRSAALARNSAGEARGAIQADLARIEDALTLDSDMVNRWLGAAIRAYVGPRAASGYSRLTDLGSRFGGRQMQMDDSPKKDQPRKGRMKTGRIVRFPLSLPPRFSIRHLDISGEGIDVKGWDVGIDHDLAGAASVISASLDGAVGFSGRIKAEFTVDGRSGSASFVEGTVDAADWAWALDTGDSGSLSGKLELEGDFLVPSDERNRFLSEGHLLLGGWGQGEGGLDFVDSESPDLGFDYKAEVISGSPAVSVRIEASYLAGWAKILAGSFLPDGAAKAREALEDAVGADLAALDDTSALWTDGDSELSGLEAGRRNGEEELKTLLEDMAGTSAVGDLNLDSPADAVEGLKSLF